MTLTCLYMRCESPWQHREEESSWRVCGSCVLGSLPPTRGPTIHDRIFVLQVNMGVSASLPRRQHRSAVGFVRKLRQASKDS